MILKPPIQKQTFKQCLYQFENATIQKSIPELWTVIFNQVIKYQLLHTRFDQIIDYKQDIYLYGKLSTKSGCYHKQLIKTPSPCFRSSLLNQKRRVYL